MSDDYTPTTEEVCVAYSEFTGFDILEREAEFYRWFAAQKRDAHDG